MKNILVTGIGGPTPKGIALSLKQANPEYKIIGIDSNLYAPGLYSGFPYDQTYLVANAQKDTAQYWIDIKNIVEKELIDFAFVVPETEVLVWCREEKENGLPCRVFLPDLNLANFLFDKLMVARFLESFDLTPKTLEINVEDDLNLERIANELNYPYWVRLNKTAGAIGALKIENKSDLINWLDLTNHRTDMIASTFLPGKNFACKVLFYNGELVLGASAERIEYLLANASPTKISGMCSRGKLLNSEELISRSVKAIKLISSKIGVIPNGMFTVDFKEDNNKIPLITEINIRHVSFTHAFALGGANFAFETLKLLETKSNNALGFFKFDEEYQFLRGVDNGLLLISEYQLDTIKKRLTK